MILMQEPSFVFNSVDVPSPTYRMWQTEDGDRGTTVADLAALMAEATRRAWEQKSSNLRNIVINCHGLDGGGLLMIGGDGKRGLGASDASQFSFLRNSRHMTGTIWITACQAANGSAGKLLCSKLATESGYQVVGSEEDQEVDAWDSYRVVTGMAHHIDEFEGKVYAFHAGGGWRVINPHEDIYTIRE